MAMLGARVPLFHAEIRRVADGWSGWEAGAEDSAFLLPFPHSGVRQTATRERASHMGGGMLLSSHEFSSTDQWCWWNLGAKTLLSLHHLLLPFEAWLAS